MALQKITTGMEKGPEAIDNNFKVLDKSSGTGKLLQIITGTWSNGFTNTTAPTATIYDLGNGGKLVTIDVSFTSPTIAPWSTTTFAKFAGLPVGTSNITNVLNPLGGATQFAGINADGSAWMVNGDGAFNSGHCHANISYITKGA